jgi:hypothetical protein
MVLQMNTKVLHCPLHILWADLSDALLLMSRAICFCFVSSGFTLATKDFLLEVNSEEMENVTSDD